MPQYDKQVLPFAQQEADDAILQGMALFETDFSAALQTWGRQNQVNALRMLLQRMTPEQKAMMEKQFPKEYRELMQFSGGTNGMVAVSKPATTETQQQPVGAVPDPLQRGQRMVEQPNQPNAANPANPYGASG